MKKTLIALLVVMISVCGTAMGQKPVKLGHINSADLMQIMPGREDAQNTIQKEVDELQTTLKNMQNELEQRYNDYMAKKDQMSDLIRQTKERELQDMGARIQEFQENAEKKLQDRQQEVLKPIIDRAKKAIEDVAKENGYTYIFDTSVGALLYQQDSEDILPLVKKKLGL
ncbi:MAG: OmpH family outer membrane protein [Bacteroidales bacterium]|nr:OmpH family outer membrane protein [Bacteroidales bacterium]